MNSNKNNIRISKNDLFDLGEVVTEFYSLFTNSNGTYPKVSNLKKIFIHQGVLIQVNSENLIIQNIKEFTELRLTLLTNGELTEFVEFELNHESHIFNNIAFRHSKYKKKGILKGEKFESYGTKFFQFIKINENWKISHISWVDH